RRILGDVVNIRRELVVGVEHLVEGDFLADVGGGAAHAGDEAGFDAALHLVVGFVVDDGVDQGVPCVLVGVGAVGGDSDAAVAGAEAHGVDGRGVLHPAGMGGQVDVERRGAPAAGPEEAVETADLVFGVGHAGGLGGGAEAGVGAVHSIGAHEEDLADFVVLD